ncbi:MAG: fibronectin type III domain-containing protein, partial [Acutalibacteraceae bacterium]|nr:fibronectin type III domain-containing protein [Acutalibacteraceae bacterium]
SGHKYTNACDETCNICSAKRTITHSYKTTTTKATLTKNGSVVKKCSVCGKVASTTVIYYPNTVKIAATTYTYNGKVITPAVTVKNSKGTALKKGTDYTVTYGAGRKSVGKYKVTVTFKGNYSGTKTFYFTINPVKTTVSKLTAGKKSIKVNITKKSTQVKGYQIQYSTSKTFKSAKTKTVSSYKTTSTTLTKLTAKKTYYVRVRTYQTVGKTNYYSAWSTYKYTKTK